MRISVDNLASVGLVRDTESRVLPPQNFYWMTNIRIDNQGIKTIDGYSVLGTPEALPYYLLSARDDNHFRFIYPTLLKIYMTTDGATHWDVSEAAGYSGDANDRWSGDNLNGLPILNNGVEEPQYMADLETTTNFAVLPGWDSNWTANIVRVFRNFIFAFNMTETAVAYPLKLRWSSSADVSGIPTAWASTPSNDAGSTSLAETRGRIVDAKTLGDYLVIYKEDAVFLCQYIGGDAVFRFSRVRTLPGMLAQDCCCEYPGGHFVVSNADIYVHDGQTKKSIAEGRLREYFFDSVSSEQWDKTFVYHNAKDGECWICYPIEGSDLPDNCLAWNYHSDVWYERKIPTSSFITDGITGATDLTWDGLPWVTWTTWDGLWGSPQYSTVNEYPIAASTEIYSFGTGNQAAGVNQRCKATSGRINLGDFDDIYRIKTIYPKASGDSFDVRIGTYMSQTDGIAWTDAVTYTPTTDHKIDVRATGRMYAIQFESNANVGWVINGYDLDVEPAGSR